MPHSQNIDLSTLPSHHTLHTNLPLRQGLMGAGSSPPPRLVSSSWPLVALVFPRRARKFIKDQKFGQVDQISDSTLDDAVSQLGSTTRRRVSSSLTIPPSPSPSSRRASSFLPPLTLPLPLSQFLSSLHPLTPPISRRVIPPPPRMTLTSFPHQNSFFPTEDPTRPAHSQAPPEPSIKGSISTGRPHVDGAAGRGSRPSDFGSWGMLLRLTVGRVALCLAGADLLVKWGRG
ncbi:hypothetical protein BDK51DRAFT_50681 [Blyttiomyces helicus]|uniref:Uncharacterized protein n=1 Tax=Blyttiomyces helicus TaxID=388810 RepID=A0A4P9W0T9_9FUNG|nr:hypothetical protein BDK51DRAFT_50681 [Blyttiomyces helicus]|eukprot:RKO85759.1 hypothetical protein BDK51DRAFT_50681 [Blyttiomyces helicus]